jgi:serine/threonine protein kinase/Tol biopolymer transport system component
VREDRHDWLDELAAAVADGRVLDWDSLDSSARTEDERSAIRRLRAIAAIGQAHSELTFSDSASESLSVRSLLQGVDDSSTPASWGSLRILERVGRGRFGDVYRAWDPTLAREVALKLLRRRDIGGINSEQDVIEEGRLMACVSHPNVVTIHGAQRIGGRTGLWMEFIDGRTLEVELKERGAFPADEVTQIGIELCRALSAVHDAGLIHRDVKAQNVLRHGSGRVILGDFGTGQELSKPALPPNHVVGTPAYLAPEVLNGAAATRESDIYSLGVLLFRLATGNHPVRGRSLAELRAAHRGVARVALRDLRPELPAKLTAVIERALEPQPSNRFTSAADMEQALIGHGMVIPASESARVRQYWFAGAFILMAFAVATLAWSQLRQSSHVAPTPPNSIPTPQHGAAPLTPAPTESAGGSNITSATREEEPIETDRSVVSPRTAGFAFVHVPTELERLVNFRRLAPDGVHATCAGGGAEVSVCDLETGVIRPIRRATAMLESSSDSLLSPDGKQVLYLWTSDRGQTKSLRLMNVDGTGDRELSRDGPNSRIVQIEHWTRDGDAVLIRRQSADGAVPFAIVSIDGVTPETPLDFNLGEDPGGDLSPDGQFLVRTKAAPGTAARDLVIRARSGHESWLLQTPSDEESARWTPDGKAVVFMSNALGALAVFMVRVENGRAISSPQLVQDFGRSTAWFRGHSDTGSLLVQLVTHWVDAFRARVDLETGTLMGLERLEPRSSSEDTASPDWDPSGQRYALVGGAIARSPTLKARIVIRRSDGRLEKEVLLPGRIERGARLRWSPDGRYLAVLYTPDPGDSSAIDVIDIDGDTLRRVVEKPGGAQNFPAGQFAWSSDSAAIYYLQERTLRRREIASGHTTVVSNLSGVFDVAPDGTIAVATQDGAGCAVRILRDEKTYERHRFRGDCTSLAWSRDGRRLLVGALTSRAYADLWSMNAEAGEPVYIRVPTELIGNMSLGPDGSSLLFSAGNPWPEFWLISGVGKLPTSSRR